MKYDVDYELDNKLRTEICMCNNVISRILVNSEIFLFGSVAKGNYTKNSDIDLLVLIDDDKTLKELRKIRHVIEDSIEELNLEHDIDIKLYNKDRYCILSAKASFEQAIKSDLIDLRGWYYGK